MLKRIAAKVHGLKHKLRGSILRAPRVLVSGLQPDEKFFKESIEEECERSLDKIHKMLPDARLGLHVKSSLQGKGKRFEVKGSLYLPGGDLHSSASDRELYGALTRVLYELQEEARRLDSYKSGRTAFR
ncbi:MAG: hypothetical protein WC607_04395 [Candidatus Micrarchaeia archaeon]